MQDNAQPIAYEVTLVTPEQADNLRHRRRLRRVMLGGALAVAVMAPSPLIAVCDRPFRTAFCNIFPC